MRRMLVMAVAALVMAAPGYAFSQTEGTVAPTAPPATETTAAVAPAAESPTQVPLEEIAPSYDEDFSLTEEPAAEPRSYSAFGEDDVTPPVPVAADAPPADAAAPTAPVAPAAEAAIPAVEWSGEPQTPE